MGIQPSPLHVLRDTENTPRDLSRAGAAHSSKKPAPPEPFATGRPRAPTRSEAFPRKTGVGDRWKRLREGGAKRPGRLDDPPPPGLADSSSRAPLASNHLHRLFLLLLLLPSDLLEAGWHRPCRGGCLLRLGSWPSRSLVPRGSGKGGCPRGQGALGKQRAGGPAPGWRVPGSGQGRAGQPGAPALARSLGPPPPEGRGAEVELEGGRAQREAGWPRDTPPPPN